MAKHDKFLKEALGKVRPSKEQRRKLEGLAKKTLGITKAVAKRHKAKAILAGSITRDTWLPDKNEFDVFVLFPEKMKEKQMESTGLQVGKAVITKLKGEHSIEYAEHPYVAGKVGDIGIDVVPCYEITSTEQLKSAVDRTPFHVKYIEKKLPLSLSNEVRLLKKFLASNDMYGADAKASGYSGYVCELLVIAYRSFLNVLKATAKWRTGEIIDLEKFYPKQEQMVHEMFKDQPLVLVDPTDKRRNTAAAVSAYNFFKFKKYAQMFLESPSSELMLGKGWQPITENELVQSQMKRRTELLIVKFIPPKVVPDILWPQLRRFADRLQSILEETKYEFKVLRIDVFTDETFIAAVVMEMEVSKLPAVQKRVGPSIFDQKDADNFLNKYKSVALRGPYTENGFWVVEVNREFMTARDKLVDSLSKPLDVLKAKGIPNHIAERIVNGFEVFPETDRIMQIVERNRDFGIFLRKYFEKDNLV